MIPVSLRLLCGLLLAAFGAKGQAGGIAPSRDSTPIYYRSFGTGEPLLIINGGPGMNSDGFEELARLLSKNFRTIIYDQRGTGRSRLAVADSTTVTMDLMTADIGSLRKHLGLQRWAVLGHSFGGMLAAYYATKHPEHISRIIFSSSGGIDLGLLRYLPESINARLSSTAQDSVRFWTERIEAGDTSHVARLRRGTWLAPAYLVDTAFVPLIAERLTQGTPVINRLVWADLDRIRFDCSTGLRAFNKPVLIIQGRQDIIRPETARRAANACRHSRLVFLEHTGHYGWLDNREAYLREINAFLAPTYSRTHGQ